MDVVGRLVRPGKGPFAIQCLIASVRVTAPVLVGKARRDAGWQPRLPDPQRHSSKRRFIKRKAAFASAAAVNKPAANCTET